MGKFKVGGRVRCVRDYIDLTVGKVYTVSAVDGDRVGVIDDVGDWNYGGKYELADDAGDTEELAELRAFRDAAIAKYPDLAPVDPDLIEARRLTAMACKWFDGGDALGKAERIERGDWDDARAGIVQAIYASLKAARGG